MKEAALILFTLWHAAMHAQQPVQTIVPLQPIAVGAAFQVQYIVTGNAPVLELQSPAFGRSFRFVSGPRLYHGEALINNKKTPIQNFSYTLIPLRKGRLVVKGATVVFASGKKKSDDTFIIATDQAKNDPLLSTPLSDLPQLAPGSTWNKKLQEQIFIKASVSKKSCFVGEPVAATFTLFSRLPSASEVIKNPGFYGFSVLEIPTAAEGSQTAQTHNGTFYNTHILRHVQLYPAQPGTLVIDKMSVNNAIEYTDSASGAPVQTTAVVESEPITVTVKPLPATNEPAFSGAVGRFTINAYLEKQKWQQNNTGKLTLTISGAGNFLQFAAPEIRWPAVINVFDPVIAERLQKEAVPVAGTRTYTYTFTTDSTGKHFIVPISFTYFDPGAKRYRTVVTDSLQFTVQKGLKSIALPAVLRKKASDSHGYLWLVATVITTVFAFFFFKRYGVRKKTAIAVTESTVPDFEKQVRDIPAGDAEAYRQLQQALMGFLKSAQVDVSRRTLLQQVKAKNTGTPQQPDLQAILDECEAVQYYNAIPVIPFEELKQQAAAFIRSTKKCET
jgi:hypothetical protein